MQAMGRWEDALEVAHAHCPLQARSVHQVAAQHAEVLGDRTTAAHHYSSAGTDAVQVRPIAARSSFLTTSQSAVSLQAYCRASCPVA
jgi:hypothetical protein